MKNKIFIKSVLGDYNLSGIQEQLVIEACISDEWDIKKDFDGCTSVSDLLHLGYPIDCLRHDFDWITGRGGKLSDQIFYDLMIARGVSKWRARKRYLGVRLAWFGWYKWKHRNNKRPPTEAMKLWEKNNKK